MLVNFVVDLPFIVGLGFFGALLPALPAIGSAIGSLFGGASEGAENQRMNQAQAILAQNRNLLDQDQLRLLQCQQGLGEAGFRLNAPTTRQDQAQRATRRLRLPGALEARAERGKQGPFQGVFQPQDFAPTDDELSLNELIQQQVLAAQRQGDDFGPMPELSQLGEIPRPGKGSKFLNIMAGIGSGLGALGPLLNRDREEQPRTGQTFTNNINPRF